MKIRELVLLSFALGLGIATGRAQTARLGILLKMSLYEQSSATGPTSLGYAASAQLELSSAPTGTVTATLVKPNGTQTIPRTAPTTFSTLEVFLARSLMDARFPDGAYTMRLEGGVTAAYAVTVTSPPTESAPAITNFTAAQSIANPSSFTLTWTPIADARTTDYVLVTVQSLDRTFSYSSAQPGEPGALPGNTNQFTLNLPPNQQFTGTVIYYRVSDIVLTSSGAIVGGAASATQFPMRTQNNSVGPSFAAQPASRVASVGETATFAVSPAGTGPFTYQWRVDGADIPGATAATLTLPSVQAFHAGTYTVVVRNSAGSATSNGATLTVVPLSTASTARLVNLATRGQAGSGANALIPGFVLAGTGSKRVMIRAVGPSLTQFGLPASDVVADPTITLVSTSTNATVGTNDDWSTGDVTAIADATRSVGAFALPAGSRDAVLITTLSAGSYTALVSGKGGDTGLAIVEVYDLDSASTGPRLVNIATRGLVGRDSRVLIPGFVVAGDAPRTYLIRGIGATLTALGVPGVLDDPMITVFQGDQVLFSNDDWASNGNSAQITAAARSVGAFDITSARDAALLVTLKPGAYTFQAAGKNGATGIALVEVYELP